MKRPRQRNKILNKQQKDTRKKRTYRKNRHKCIDEYYEFFMLFNESVIEPYNKSNENKNKDNEIVLLATDPTITNTHLNILRKGLSFIPKPKTFNAQELYNEIKKFMIITRQKVQHHQRNRTKTTKTHLEPNKAK